MKVSIGKFFGINKAKKRKKKEKRKPKKEVDFNRSSH
jgi:hypothetical protein